MAVDWKPATHRLALSEPVSGPRRLPDRVRRGVVIETSLNTSLVRSLHRPAGPLGQASPIGPASLRAYATAEVANFLIMGRLAAGRAVFRFQLHGETRML